MLQHCMRHHMIRAWVGRYVFRVLGSLARPGFETLPYHTLPYHTYRTMMDRPEIFAILMFHTAWETLRKRSKNMFFAKEIAFTKHVI